MYFENIFLLWPQLSVLISKALLKEMAAREGANLAQGTGLGSEASSGSGRREQGKDSRGGRKTKRGRGLKDYGKARSSFTAALTEWKETHKSSIVSVVPAVSVAVPTSFTSSAEHTKGLRVCVWVA